MRVPTAMLLLAFESTLALLLPVALDPLPWNEPKLPVVTTPEALARRRNHHDRFGERVLALVDVQGSEQPSVRILALEGSTGNCWVLCPKTGAARRAPAGSVAQRGTLQSATDLDRDGRVDWIQGGAGAWEVRSGSTLAWIAGFTSRELCAIGDVDADGEPDFAFARLLPSARGEPSRLHVNVRSRAVVADLWEMDARVSYLPDLTHLLAATDVDRDGVPDLLVLSDRRAVVHGGRDGRPIVELGETARLPVRCAAVLGDLDGDERPEFVLGRPDTSCGETPCAHVEVVSGMDGRRVHQIGGVCGAFGSSIAAGSDFDGDGCPDFAVATHGGGGFEGVIVYSGATARELRRIESDWDCHRSFSLAFVPDVDGDRVDELVIGAIAWAGANCDDGSVTVWSGARGQLLRTWTKASRVELSSSPTRPDAATEAIVGR